MILDAVAPALLVAQGLGRIGNYFNKELFGGPTSLPWGLQIPLAYRPPGYTAFAFFQPTFLYELIWDVALALALIWLGPSPAGSSRPACSPCTWPAIRRSGSSRSRCGWTPRSTSSASG